MNKKLKHVIIGVGAGVLNMHRPALQQDSVELVGVTDVNPDLGNARADELGCPFFANVSELLETTKPDIAVILAPHPFHASLAITCLNAGVHVLVEKPIAVQVSEADAMIAAAKKADRLLAVSFQQRFRPEIQAAKQILESGKLGNLQHVDMLVNWFRSTVYFASGKWRATWQGEGGGVLMNQAPHNLDLLCYLIGLPKHLTAWTRTQLHSIEVEDTVQAMLEWESGCLGSVHISTAESGREERLEIAGTAGVMRLGQGELHVNLFEMPLERFTIENQNMWSAPATKPFEAMLPDTKGDHVAVYQNLHDAILRGTPLLVSAAEARNSLELANAMILSSYQKQALTLPIDRTVYSSLLESLKAGPSMSLGVAIIGTGMVASYHQQAILANGATLVAVAHHNPQKFDQLSKQFGVPCLSFKQVLEHPEVEAVCICTPSGQHTSQAIAAAKAGKHVLVEKPMALSLEDADTMIQTCQHCGVQLGVVLQRRSETLFQQVKAAIEAGDLGDITLGSVTMPYLRPQSYYDQADWRGTKAQDGGGVLMNQGIHLLDLLLWFMGDPIKVSAYASTLQRNIEVEDTLVATLQFASGALATFTATTTTAPGFPHRLEIYGTQGGIQLEGEGVRAWTLNHPAQAKVNPVLLSDSSAGSGGDPRGIKPTGHINLFKDFMQTIKQNRAPLMNGQEGRRSLKTILEIYRAAHLSNQ